VTDETAGPSDRRCLLSLAPCAGAYWRRPCPRVRSGGSRVHLPSPPPRSSTGRRVSLPAHDGYSSRSQPTSSVTGSLRGLCRNGQARPGHDTDGRRIRPV